MAANNKTWTILPLLFALCLTMLSSVADASPHHLIVTGTCEKETPLGKYLDIFEDPQGLSTITDVLRPESAEKFSPSKDLVPNFGFTPSAF